MCERTTRITSQKQKYQLSNVETYEETIFNEHDHSGLVNWNNDWFFELKLKKLFTKKEYKYFTNKSKKLLIWVNFIFFPKYTKGYSMYWII